MIDMTRPMDSWRLAYDQARAIDDEGTCERLLTAWDRAVDEIEAEGLDSNDDDVVAARTLDIYMRDN